jgi:hypothetical protein
MKRRKAIKDLLVASGGTLTLPFWMQACRSSDRDGYAEMLTAVVDTIIPGEKGASGNGANGGKDGGPGALGLGVDKFVEKMIADCYEQPVQDNVRKQLAALREKGFVSATQPRREELLLKLAGSADKSEKDFFSLIKGETIRGFNTSQKVMEAYFGYTVAPGHYYGCVSIKS